MTPTTPAPKSPRYLSPAEQHELFNEPLSEDYPTYPQWINAAVWIPIIFGFITMTGLAGYGLYLLFR